MTKAYITTISFNNNDATLECLDSIDKLDKEDIELYVVVIDNASKEKFEKKKEFKNFHLKIIRNEENLGFSGGQNMGIKYAIENGADFVVVLNNDTIVDKKLIESFISAFDNKTGIIAPKIYFAPGFEFHRQRYKEKDKAKVIWYAGGIMDFKNVIARHRGVDEVDNGQYNRKTRVDFASGCCMAIRRDVLEKVGLFDEKYFLYYEDNDLSKRAVSAGFEIIFEPKAILWHKNAASAGGSGSLLQDYYITRNRLLFGLKYAPIRSKLALIRESLRLVYSGRRWQKQGVKDFYLGKFGRGSFNP